jgi:thioredoxin-related protein
MTTRQRIMFAAALCVTLGLAATYKLGPRIYNRVRLDQLQGRRIYDEHADVRALYLASLAQAKRDNKQLLVMLGGNWCQWCLALDDLMHQNAALRDYVAAHYVVLKLDSQAAKPLDEAWGNPTRQGVPVLIFVDHAGGLKHIQETVSLELWSGRILGHDPKRVLAVLQRWG